MIGYSLIPVLFTLLMVIAQILIFGVGVFQSDFDYNDGGLSTVVFYSSLLMELLFSVWSIVLGVVGIAVVQKFSYGRAFVNGILPALVVVFPIAVIAFLVFDLMA